MLLRPVRREAERLGSATAAGFRSTGERTERLERVVRVTNSSA